MSMHFFSSASLSNSIQFVQLWMNYSLLCEAPQVTPGIVDSLSFLKNLKSLKESCLASPTLRACALELVEQILVPLLNIQVIFWGKLLNFMGYFCLKFCVNMLYPGSSKNVIIKEKRILILYLNDTKATCNYKFVQDGKPKKLLCSQLLDTNIYQSG